MPGSVVGAGVPAGRGRSVPRPVIGVAGSGDLVGRVERQRLRPFPSEEVSRSPRAFVAVAVGLPTRSGRLGDPTGRIVAVGGDLTGDLFSVHWIWDRSLAASGAQGPPEVDTTRQYTLSYAAELTSAMFEWIEGWSGYAGDLHPGRWGRGGRVPASTGGRPWASPRSYSAPLDLVAMR